MHREAFALICPQGGEHTPAATLILKPSTSPQYTLIKHQPRGDPSPASHFLPFGYSATPPPSSARWFLSLPLCLPIPPTTTSPAPTPSLCQPCIWRPRGATDSLPVASRSWAEQVGPPAVAWNTHPPRQHPPSAHQHQPGDGLAGGSLGKLPIWKGWQTGRTRGRH